MDYTFEVLDVCLGHCWDVLTKEICELARVLVWEMWDLVVGDVLGK